ncbi:hypothetical protein DPQ33_05620 [Oceanidesulfovibrio indonesiensis]|uniref:Uncharacterized protein n=1 Tax=Oceanidesulfovibrio indonesiensis TaxID=54767 RepID=A0A7M3MFY6_9BACT|nr:hypothetical protein [Oceanidesulfovibrio indonesiensis]TVM18234.1 hypothetical protein DPQ33_05620 [Oceanidesulfovibrio indonesiensis]
MTNQSTTSRPLGLLREIMETIGLEATYAYDDLVFASHNVYLVQFPEDAGGSLRLFFNKDCEEDTARAIENAFVQEAARRDLKAVRAGLYELIASEEDEEIEVTLMPEAD